MKKILLLLILIVTLTGCSVNYDLEIFNEEYREKISLDGTSLTAEEKNYEIPIEFDETRVTTYKTSEKTSQVSYYKKNQENNFQTYYNNFKMEEYYKSYFVNSSFDFFGVYYDDILEETEEDVITISTNFKMKAFDTYKDLEKVTVNIKTNHKVKSNNADSKDGFTYTWNYTRDNYQNKSIQIVLSKDKYVFNYDGNFYRNVLIVGGIISLLILVCVIFIKKSQKLNKV